MARTELYYREDLRALLQAIQDSVTVLCDVPGDMARAYVAGHDAALKAVATALDVKLKTEVQIKQELIR